MLVVTSSNSNFLPQHHHLILIRTQVFRSLSFDFYLITTSDGHSQPFSAVIGFRSGTDDPPSLSTRCIGLPHRVTPAHPIPIAPSPILHPTALRRFLSAVSPGPTVDRPLPSRTHAFSIRPQTRLRRPYSFPHIPLQTFAPSRSHVIISFSHCAHCTPSAANSRGHL